MNNKKNNNEYGVPNNLYGSAITYTYEKEDGTMWVGNEEYESRVNFCPITGKPATNQMKLIKEFKLDNDIVKYYE